ncbi:hypothetical protein BJ170DRAFT_711411 [Xylariales sp. AK1849]|nr:hypothetical protein BJ170DRAFT_711411 [Xylariales sp. AK1849]
MPPPLLPRQDGIAVSAGQYVEPPAGTVVGVLVTLVAISILSSFLTQRFLAIKAWRKVPFIVWLVLSIYADSWLFVFITAVLKHGMGLNTSYGLCSSAILLCLVCYVTTKMVYLFLVERAFIVRNGTKPRLESKLYIFNSFGMLTIYLIVSIINFIFRITRVDKGQCVIGMRREAMLPLITFDLLVNIYLTMLFIFPLRRLYTFKDMPRTPANVRIRTVAVRTLVGALSTTVSSVVNLTVLMVLDGEPGWVCLMCCNCDILFSAVILQWVTSRDNAGTVDAAQQNNSPSHYRDSFRGTPTPLGHHDSSVHESLNPYRGGSGQKPILDDMDITSYTAGGGCLSMDRLAQDRFSQ